MHAYVLIQEDEKQMVLPVFDVCPKRLIPSGKRCELTLSCVRRR
jgi:hypothetical protein